MDMHRHHFCHSRSYIHFTDYGTDALRRRLSFSISLSLSSLWANNFYGAQFSIFSFPTMTILIRGENIIRELLDKNMILLPFAIDPFGRWGPITRTFLTGNGTNTTYTFPVNRPNAATMFKRATTTPCPTGILRTADANWKSNRTRTFYGFSYTSPTPSIHTLQQLGLGITKAFSLHIRNATKQYGSTCDAPPITTNVEI